jgi:hypothetical protein
LGLQTVMPETTPVLPALSRQNAFGSGLRSAARHLQIGIIGVGGIGMLAAEQLARAGFCRFVLIDHDRIEQTNLNTQPPIRMHNTGAGAIQGQGSESPNPAHLPRSGHAFGGACFCPRYILCAN